MNSEQRAELVDYIAAQLNFVNSEGMYSQANLRARAEQIADRAATVAEPDAVERVKRAMFDALGDRKMTYETFVEQDTEKVRAAIFAGSDLGRMARSAIAAMASCADDNWLDAALDSVHPVCRIDWIECEYDNPGKWTAQISYPTGGIAPGTQADDEYIEAVGTGATRREAILDAVRKAKEAQQ